MISKKQEKQQHEDEQEECVFLQEREETKQKMKKLKNYKVKFGKYKDDTFEELGDDRDYSLWLHKQTEFIAKNQALKEYIEYRLTQPI